MNLRQNEVAALKSICALIPREASRCAAARLVAASIRLAHRQAPGSWELTAWPHAIRLNVGQITVLDVTAEELRVYSVRGPSLKANGYRLTEFGHYTAVDVASECWGVPIAAADAIVSSLVDRHRTLVLAAATAKRVSPFKRSHSPGFVRAIATITGEVLPQPAYHESDGAVNDSDTPEAAERLCFGDPSTRREVEQAAVRIVTAELEAKGWQVHSRERDRCGYDLRCTKRGVKELHVEVKGVSNEPRQFIITAGEVRQAETDGAFKLFLVGRALTARPTMESWTGEELLRLFSLSPLQFLARRGAI